MIQQGSKPKFCPSLTKLIKGYAKKWKYSVRVHNMYDWSEITIGVMFLIRHLIAVVDPAFPSGGGEPQRVELSYYLVYFLLKTAWKWIKWTERGHEGRERFQIPLDWLRWSCSWIHVNSRFWFNSGQKWLAVPVPIKRTQTTIFQLWYVRFLQSITSNHRKTGVNGVWIWIFECGYCK